MLPEDVVVARVGKWRLDGRLKCGDVDVGGRLEGALCAAAALE
jgi:hypothetical protein